MTRSPRAPLSSLALVLLVASCSRDLTLPQRPQRPVITGPALSRGYYADTIQVTGTGFDANPAQNTIEFQGGVTAQAFAISDDGSTLSVYVPTLQGSFSTGTLRVSNSGGTSLPGGAFLFLGQGHPSIGNLNAEIHVSHQPGSVVSIKGKPVLPSTTFRAILGSNVPSMDVGTGFASLTRSLDGTRLYAGYAVGSANAVVAIDPATRKVTATSGAGPAAATLISAPLAAGLGESVVYSVGEDAERYFHAAAYVRSGATLSIKDRRLDFVDATYGIAALPSDLGVLMVIDRVSAGRVVRRVLKVNPSDVGAPPVEWTAPDGLVPNGPITILDYDDDLTAVLGLADGGLALMSVTDTPTWTRLDAASVSPVASVSGRKVDGRPVVIATVPHDSLAYALDPAQRALLWSAPLRETPLWADIDATEDRVSVASAVSNAVDLFVASTGAFLGRIDFGLELGNDPACACGAVAPYSYDADAKGIVSPTAPERILILARSIRKVVPLEASTLRVRPAIDLVETASAPLGLVRQGVDQPWVVHRAELGILEKNGEKEDRLVERLAVSGLPEVPSHVAFAHDGRVLIGSTRAVDVYRFDGELLKREGGLPLPATGVLRALEVLPTGLVSVLWSYTGDGPWVEGGAWSVDHLSAGTAADVPFASPDPLGYFLGLVSMEFGPLAFFQGLSGAVATAPSAIAFSSAAVPATPEPSILTEPGVLVPTPDRRYFAAVPDRPDDPIVRTGYYYPGLGMYDYGTYRLRSPAARPTFDPSGEWLYVPVPALDTIVVLQ